MNILGAIIIVGLLLWGGYKMNDEEDTAATPYFTEPDYGFEEEDSYFRYDDPEVERSYEDYGDYDCDDFSSQEEAQEFFESEGGPDGDFHNLDRDGDGWVCETL